MAKVTYTLLDRPLSSITDNEKYSEADLSLIDNYEINKQYNFDKHYIESHFYSIYNTKLLSVYDYEIPTEIIVNNEDLSTTNVTQLSLRPQDIAVEYGFVQTDVSIVFHFLNDLYTIDNAKQSFYIQDISQDRKEILLYSDKIETNQLINITEDLKDHFRDNQYFEELWLNCGENDLFIVTNVDTYELEDKFTIALKLYEPLPKRYGIKSFVQVVEKVSDSIVVQVEPEVEPAIVVKPKLRPANFDVKLELPNANPTQYFNYDELFSYDNSNSNRELYSILNEKSVAVNIDHNNYKEFIHFSSATERLKNFKYKLQLIESYQTSLDTVNGLSATNTINVVGSNSRYTNLIKGIVGNFDHYERHLYFDSGSSSWPKITSTKPYTNTVSTEMTAVNWYNSQLISASNYDAQNYDVLGNALPEYIRDDNANNPGVLFTHMIGQHFDNLWIYTKAITDKYNADNRVNVGVSKDLVKEAIKSLGVKIHNSEEGSTDLFKYLIADAYDSGSQLEVITQFNSVPGISADEQPISRKEYETEVYKRIYHNIPFLTKAKGTQRGIRALINCFGIPSEFLKIKQYGGKSIGESKFFNYDKHSEDANAKVRIETRVSGSVNTTLSEDVSIQKSENVLTQDIHRIEVGFSPTDSIDEYILTQLASDFSIDQYLGDPRNENKLEYNGLVEQERRTIGSLERYQLNDFVRILKFYDNTLFKMIKDFLPARTTADTGIIIKPGLLSKSKTKAPEMTGTQHDHEGAIDTAFMEGYDAGAYDTALFSKTEKYQTELINKWSPGSIGGVSNLSFKLNKQIPNTDNIGEIIVTGTELIHPNGTEYKYLDRSYNIFTGLEGNTSSHRKSFLMHSDQGVVARFPTLTTLTDSTHHPNIVVVLYDNNSWNAVDNNSTMATFTPLASDLIIASIGMTPNAGQIDEFYSFMKSFINYKPEIKTTLYSQKVKTISGLVHKLVQDESPKYNGELSGSVLEITDGELNSLNNFKIVDAPLLRYDVTTVESTFSGVLTPFIVNPNSQAAAITACNLSGVSATVTFYHDAFTALPGINGVIYKDSGANALLDGGQNFYLHPGSSQAFQIDTDGTVMSIVDCGQFDNIPGAPPTPASAFRSKIVNNGNKSLVPIVITNAEAGTTANITASLGTDKVLKAISIPSQGYASTNLDLTTIPDTTGTEIALSVKLTDQAGNQSLESTVNTDIGSFGKTIVKDTQPISGHTVTFVTSFLGSTPQMTNTTGAFFMKVTGLPTTEQVSYNATISSTGGVISSYVSGLNLNGFNNGSGNSTGHISLFSSQHNFNNGTVTVYLTVVDAAGNQSLSITDTVLYSSGNASMSPSTVSQGSNAGTGTIQITSNTSWSLYSYSNWISLSSGSGTGNAIRTWSTSTNYGGSRTGYVKLSTGGNIVDTLTITQSAGGSNSQACVDPETDITLEHGDTIKARDIKTGDIVRTKHETTMEMLSCIVIGAQLVPFSRKLKIVYSDRDLICSLRHRVYVDNKSEFIAADLLEVGDITTGYEIVDIVEVEEGEVIKLSVEKAQTYISNGILSHNAKTIQ